MSNDDEQWYDELINDLKEELNEEVDTVTVRRWHVALAGVTATTFALLFITL